MLRASEARALGTKVIIVKQILSGGTNTMTAGHTVVVGGGVIGVSTAYYLAQRGQRVTLLEQGELCSGSSQGNAGQVTPGHLPLPQPGTLVRNLRWLLNSKSPLYVAPRLDVGLLRWLWRFQLACNSSHMREATEVLCRLGAASNELFDELRDSLEIPYHQPGRMEVCRGERCFAAACEEADLLEEFGFESQRLRGPAVREFEPALQADVAGAVYYPRSGYCNPETFVLRLAEAAQQLGVTLVTNKQVTDLCVENGRLTSVAAGDEIWEADAFALTCGAWAPQLARRLHLALPVQPGKGYHLDIERPESCPRYPVVLMEERIFVSPLNDFLRLAGTMEFSGFNLQPRPQRLEMLAVGAGRYFPEVPHATVHSRWCHLRPMTPDGLPILGRAPEVGNVWIATGHGMLGFTQGPITGKLIADWIIDGEASIDVSACRPERF
jgi:D-amino-acid dehydrogenase